MLPLAPGYVPYMAGYYRFSRRRFVAVAGAALRVKFWNALDETSIIHWHGLHVDSNNDGHPHYAVRGGATVTTSSTRTKA